MLSNSEFGSVSSSCLTELITWLREKRLVPRDFNRLVLFSVTPFQFFQRSGRCPNVDIGKVDLAAAPFLGDETATGPCQASTIIG